LAVLAAALVAPADALAADYVYLSLDQVRLKNGWTLSGAVRSSDYGRVVKREVVGVMLAKRISPIARERHHLNLHPVGPTIMFDSATGHWRVASTKLVVDLTVTAVGEPEPVEEWLGCRGAFARVPVRLDGTFAVKTGKAPFGTIRRTSLRASVTYNTGGPVVCSAGGACADEEWLTAFNATGGTLRVGLTRRSAALFFRDRFWTHLVEFAGIDSVSGALPRFSVRLPGYGRGTFVAGDREESVEGDCRSTRTTGAFTGSFRATFTGWGKYMFAGGSATHVVTDAP
jgi:hypothetical protein